MGEKKKDKSGKPERSWGEAGRSEKKKRKR
jgi:hypothetical protein